MKRTFLVVASLATLVLGTPLFVWSQSTPEPLKGADRTAYQNLKELKAPVVVVGNDKQTADNRALLAKQAKYMVSQLTDPGHIKRDDLARVIEQAISSDLPIYRLNRPKLIKDDYLSFSREMGEALVKELQPVVKHPKIIVRLNAARMLWVVGLMGYDKATELALQILEDPKENEGVKYWALGTLHNVLGFVVDADLPEQSVFRRDSKDPKNDTTEWERKSIIALCNYISPPAKPELKTAAGSAPAAEQPKVEEPKIEDDDKKAELAAVKYIRREAVRTLGWARTPRLKYKGEVLAQPALILAKVMNKDGIVPEPDLAEQAEAVVGFCRLFPYIKSGADRDVQIDYAAHLLAASMRDIAQIKADSASNNTITWKVVGSEWEDALNKWQNNVAEMKLAGNAAAKTLFNQAKADLIDQLKSGNALTPPNTPAFRRFMEGNKPKAGELFQGDPNSKVMLKGS